MAHGTPLITTLVVGLCLAFLFGAVANRLRLSPLVGYLIAGVIIGPFTPGYVADQGIANQLAELGIVLLMFGVGLHFSPTHLMSVRAIAVPGAILQMVFVSVLGLGLAKLLGWSTGAGLVFGISLSVASTVVVLRSLQEQRLIQTDYGRIAVGWLIVEDLAMILVLVLLPTLSGLFGGRTDALAGSSLLGYVPETLAGTLGFTFLKVAAFVVVVLGVGRLLVPSILHYAAHTGSRELFRLAVLAVSLGIAFGSAELFGVSFALGAFFAGMVLAESPLSHQAAQETLPLRDAFAVLFFVSVGMLFDPSIVVREPAATVATFLIIIVGNSAASLAVLLAFRYPLGTALALAVSLSQIGEFSFILAGLGVTLGLLSENGRDLILAGAILSILANPALAWLADRWATREEQRAPSPAAPAKPKLEATALSGHAVLVGYGRVGNLVGAALEARAVPLLVIEERQDVVDDLRKRGIEAFAGNAASGDLLAAVNLAGAKWLISAIPNPFEAGNLIEHARGTNPGLTIIARAHSDAEVAYLQKLGASQIVMGETEIAHAISDRIFAGEPASVEPQVTEAAPAGAPVREPATAEVTPADSPPPP